MGNPCLKLAARPNVKAEGLVQHMQSFYHSFALTDTGTEGLHQAGGFQHCANVYKFIIIAFYHFPATTKAPLKEEE